MKKTLLAIVHFLSRTMADKRRQETTGKPDSQPTLAGHIGQQEQATRAPLGDNSRFADYLSSTFSKPPPLRHEREAQRNRALVLLAFVFFLLVWLIYRFAL
ncbi:MAG: hypothetical protein N2255_10735 [Kiritimatiellae bacterium]|nr:hypothetical protein [Kiritimatiellia bacterium]